MGFTFPTRLTEDDILERVSDVEIFNTYFGEPVRPGKLYRSRLRNDRRPTVGFFTSSGGRLLCHDFGTGETWGPVNYVARLHGLSYGQALSRIAADAGMQGATARIARLPMTNDDFTRGMSVIGVEVRAFTPEELAWWKTFGITLDILGRYRVHACRHLFLNGKVHAESTARCPIYCYYGGREGDTELWKAYFPFRKDYRFIGNFPKSLVQGHAQLPDNGPVVCVTKSMKDVMCLASFGIPAVAPNSETLFLPDAMLEDLTKRFRRMVVLYDNDRPGMAAMARIRRAHPGITYAMVPLSTGSKDISDHHRDHGRDATRRLITTFLEWLEKDTTELRTP